MDVRLLLADPASPRIAERGAEEGIGPAVAARVHNALALFRPLLEADGVQARQHDTVLYNSIFRADDEMLVNPQVHGIAAAYAPVLQLRHVEPGGMFATYVDCFERVWADAAPMNAFRVTTSASSDPWSLDDRFQLGSRVRGAWRVGGRLVGAGA